MKVTKPTLLINEQIAKANIECMFKKAVKSNVEFRPHFKTHFSHEIGHWYREVGVNKITVSSIDMAVYFAQDGWTDITIAFPVNILEIDTLNNLAKKISINLLIESVETAEYLSTHLLHPATIFIKIDTGYGRAGIPWNDLETIKSIIQKISGRLTFKGLLAHFGHTYKERNPNVIEEIHIREVGRINETKSLLGMTDIDISIGDTPSCSVIPKFSNVNEVRPGNFIFYDLMQLQIGSCSWNQIAVCMACPVVSVHVDKNEIIIHGGAVHFSKDHLNSEGVQTFYGQVVQLTPDGWGKPNDRIYLKSVSQEHGIVVYPKELIHDVAVGDILGILPIHSCLTANLMKDYQSLTGRRITTMNSIPERLLH